jgi:hypothetical protein
VLVIWEPVLDSDERPPTDAVRVALADPRVTEYWDGNRWMSPRAMERARMMARAAGQKPPGPDQIAWDFVAIFPPETAWQDPFPVPSWHGEPVVKSLDPVERVLQKQ